jgi:hypothetical protein
MPTQHRQLAVPRRKASGNPSQAIVYLPEHEFRFTVAGREGEPDVRGDTSAKLAAATHNLPLAICSGCTKAQGEDEIDLRELKNGQARTFITIYSKLDTLLKKIKTVNTKNTLLREAYSASREETAALKAAVDNLMKKLDDTIAITARPPPDTMAPSTSMEEMTMQLSIIQNDIQDILEAVRNPPGKRKR